ncbi:MAG: hypothetical protein IJP18_06820 [Oscillospiraceae bacterium]|nr:hypothetical protein [Oscillospiraceae bacterium]
MLKFYPIGVRSEGIRKVYYYVPDELVTEKETVVHFFSNYISKDVNEELLYYICLEKSSLLFKITPDRTLTGMVFSEEMLIYSWINLFKIIKYLKATTFEEIEKITELDLSTVITDNDRINEEIRPLESKYSGMRVPKSFITGKYSHSFFGVEKGSVDFPLADYYAYSSGSKKKEQKKCIPYSEEVVMPRSVVSASLEYVSKSNVKKGFFQKLKAKKEKEVDFIEETYLKYDGGNDPVIEVSELYTLYDDPASHLMRFDKLIKQAGG